jgi:hypothetical protein
MNKLPNELIEIVLGKIFPRYCVWIMINRNGTIYREIIRGKKFLYVVRKRDNPAAIECIRFYNENDSNDILSEFIGEISEYNGGWFFKGTRSIRLI